MGFWDNSHYRVNLVCDNCGHVADYALEFGVPVEPAAKNRKCKRCGVMGMLVRQAPSHLKYY